MTRITYTIFDGNPASSGDCSWPHRTDVELEVDEDDDALDLVRDALDIEAHGLSEADGYSAGDKLWAVVEYEDCTIDTVSIEITSEHLA